MSERLHLHAALRSAATVACLLTASLLTPLGYAGRAAPRQGQAGQAATDTSKIAAPTPPKGDAKKAKQAYERGVRAEKGEKWQDAYDAYAEAVELDSNTREYFLRREVAKSRLVQSKMDLAERDAISGRISAARQDLLEARYLDPTNTFVRDRLAELSALTPTEQRDFRPDFELSSEIHLDYKPGKRNFDFRGDTQGAYQEVGRQFGVEVAFDVDLTSRVVRLQLSDVDFVTAMRILGDMTGTFWRPLTTRLFFVAVDSTQKRKDYDVSVVRTIQLTSSQTPEQMTEMLRLVREISGIIRSDVDLNSRTITVRATPQAVAVASGLIEDLEKPTGELVLEIEVLQVDKNYARQIGITPPQQTKVFTLSPQQVQQAQQSLTGLVDVIGAVFGLPSSLSGLTSTQVASLLSAGQLAAGTLVPPLAAFGGGSTTFLATVPGASANFSRMLSLVQHGQRILLRAQDGQAATFFVGSRIPVSLTNFSSSLGGTASSIPGVSSSSFPTTNYATGTAPTSVAAASLRNNSDDDLIVSNFTDNTISVLLGNGDGTFGTQTTFSTSAGPSAIATGEFSTTTGSSTVDLAVANQTSNTVSILLGNGDGTFQPRTDLPTGTAPVAVAAAQLNSLSDSNLDLAVANHGDNTVSIFLGNGDGTFKAETPIALPAGYAPSFIATGDFNGDGFTDLAVTDEGNATVSIFLGNGDGTFKSRVDYAVGTSPVWASAADLNGDGILDLAVANKDSNTVSILLGTATTTNTALGTGAFAGQTSYPAGNGPTSIAVADYNVDGRPDLAVADESDNSVSILLGTGAGVFGPNFELPVGTSPVSIVSAVLSSTGDPDVAVVNNGSNNVSVILNSAAFSGSLNGLTGVPYPGVQYLDIGLKIKATPRIHANSEVTLALEFEDSSLSASSFNQIPVINSETLNQTVRVKENETAMLAGIVQPQTTNAVNGWPGIGDIPGLGAIASNQNAQNSDSELLILVTPRMVRLAPRQDHVIYAGQGSLDSGGAGASGAVNPPLPGNVPPPQGPGPNPAQPAGQTSGQPSGPAQPNPAGFQPAAPVAPQPPPSNPDQPQTPQPSAPLQVNPPPQQPVPQPTAGTGQQPGQPQDQQPGQAPAAPQQ
jgi:hypothetical protein